MSVGSKIKEFRKKVGLTQNDLANQLHVSYQVVFRWENDDTKPSNDMLKELCRILKCSMDDLSKIEKNEDPKVEEKVIIYESKPVLGVCEKCNNPIYESSDLNRVDESFIVRTGKIRRQEIRRCILCNRCNQVRLQEAKSKEDQQKREVEATFKKRRIRSFIWPTLAASPFIFVGFSSLVNNGEMDTVFGSLFFGIIIYCFLANMILNNTFLSEMWLEITSWGFVKLPGIIFEFSIDGFIFLIAMKLLFFLVGIFFVFVAAAFATALAAALSIFVYPFALIKNFKYEE